MGLTKITYAELAEVKEAYNRLAQLRVGELPDTTKVDEWLKDWAAKKGYPFTCWKDFNVHIVPTEEHKKERK